MMYDALITFVVVLVFSVAGTFVGQWIVEKFWPV